MRWNSCVIFIIAVTFCVKFGKSATKILKMICWAFADSSFRLDKGIRMTCVSRPVKCRFKRMTVHGGKSLAKCKI